LWDIREGEEAEEGEKEVGGGRWEEHGDEVRGATAHEGHHPKEGKLIGPGEDALALAILQRAWN